VGIAAGRLVRGKRHSQLLAEFRQHLAGWRIHQLRDIDQYHDKHLKIFVHLDGDDNHDIEQRKQIDFHVWDDIGFDLDLDRNIDFNAMSIAAGQ
jgi:hypothetical protein